MPAALEYIAFLAAAGESELGPSCPACGSRNVIAVESHGPSGVVAPDGGEEFRSQEGYKCRDCGAIEEV
jgi:hypothetical protein